jgi:DNA-binding beta-propeller fold protein YncE
MANQIQKKFIADDAIDGSKLLLEQNQTIRQKDGSGGEIDVVAQINESIDDAKQEAKDYADQKISEIPEIDLSEIEQAIEDVGNALENEAQVREDADEALDAKIEIEKGRIDAILDASEADKDSFAEIVSLINSVDTANDEAFAGYVLSNNAALAQEILDRQGGDAALGLEIDAVELALAGKEDKANKSIDIALGASDELYPTQKAVKTYADAQDSKAVDAVLSGVGVDGFLPNPNSIETQIRHYSNGVALDANKRYAAYFTDTQMIFVDAVNPFTAKIIQSFTIPTGGSNFPQAATSVGNYVYMTTGGGRLYCFDWTDKANPQNLGFVAIGTGQHFDVTTDGLNTLFIANTTNKRVYVVDITNRAAGTLVKSLILGAGASDFGTGVAHSSGYLYVANYNSKLHVMKKDPSTGDWSEILNFATIVNPCRTAVFTNSKGQKLLFAQRYNGVDAVVLDLANPELPVELKRVQAPASIQIYNLPFMFKDMIHIGLDNGKIGSVNIFDKTNVKYGDTFEPKNADGSKKFSSMRGLVRMDTSSPFFKEKTFLLATGVINGAGSTQKVTTVIDLPMFDYINSSAVTTEVNLTPIQSELVSLDSRLDTVESTLLVKADLVGGLVPASQLPSYVDDVLEFANLAAFPASGEAGKIYVALDTNKCYRWSGSTYVEITSGAVDSVNGQNGVVVLDAGDIQMVSEATSIEAKLVSLQDEIDAEESRAAGVEAGLDLRIEALEEKGFAKGVVTVGSELGFIDLDRTYATILSMSVGRLAVHEDEDYTTSIVGGLTRITWIGSLLNPSGSEKIETGDKVFWSGAY